MLIAVTVMMVVWSVGRWVECPVFNHVAIAEDIQSYFQASTEWKNSYGFPYDDVKWCMVHGKGQRSVLVVIKDF